MFAKNMMENSAKIFRPWDMRDGKVQEAIISTTTSEEQTGSNVSVPSEKAPRAVESVATTAVQFRLDATSLGSNKVLKSFRKKRRDSAALTGEKAAAKRTAAKAKNEPLEGEEKRTPVSAFSCASSSSPLCAIITPDLRTPFSPQPQGCQLSSCAAESYPSVYPAEYLAHSLGLAATDPLFLESMAHGYAMEEYARILNEEHQAKLMSGRKQRPKKYRCPHCDVGFSNNGQLKGHIRIHTGERPFKCEEKNCGKTFTRNEELTRHKRIHSGLRPFPCSHCGKRFGRKDHLKKHSRTHLQPRALYAALPVMLPAGSLDAAACYHAAAAAAAAGYPIPMYGY